MLNRIIFILLAFVVTSLVNAQQQTLLDEGVSWTLAEHRHQTIHGLHYELWFSIPENKSEDVQGKVKVRLSLIQRDSIILDFRESRDKIHEVSINGKRAKWHFQNEHIIILSDQTRKGENVVEIRFTAGNQSLNRRDSYVYTLFVPDRARTVFPCFEQPNLKAKFRLHLQIPEGWRAVTNSSPVVEKSASFDPLPGYQVLDFAESEPLPTYLFAFAAGAFQYQTYTEDGRTIGALYRETDPQRIAQLPDIFHQVIFSLNWQERFTGVEYPFQKYDLVILPGFQFGGMEHTGATFYNDNTLFLPANSTPDEQLRRTELISHETSHMWFGDAVTMNWFDDVWTKEVFANYFAAEITAPLFPTLNHDLNWLKTYVAAAVSQDRTEGRTSIRQPLDNMRYAGLIYNSIIYNKAPVMMRKMVELMGRDAYQRGIQKYVQKYKYGNATWDDLIDILDAETPVDLKVFSKDWVDTANWPQYRADSCLDARIGREYGFFEWTDSQIDSLMKGKWGNVKDETLRQALLMNLNENYLERGMDEVRWMDFLIQAVEHEENPLTVSTLINYMYEPIRYTHQPEQHFDSRLWQLAQKHSQPVVRTQLLRLLISRAQEPSVVDSLYNMWEQDNSPLLSINDYMTMSYELAIRMPDQADSILPVQRTRIQNPDRLAQFDFISRAVNPSVEARDSLFASLQKPENRRIEPWTLSVLYYLNHPLRDVESVRYIRPALEWLPDIQRTGDIFFPGNWCSSLLSGHRSSEAEAEVQSYLKENPGLMPLLRNKVLQASYYLDRKFIITDTYGH